LVYLGKRQGLCGKKKGKGPRCSLFKRKGVSPELPEVSVRAEFDAGHVRGCTSKSGWPKKYRKFSQQFPL